MRRLRHVIRPRAPEPPPDRGLDAVNLLLAASGALTGAFIPVFLVTQTWTQAQVGLLLAVGTIASMAFQVPAGLLVDLLGPRRRAALAIAVASMAIPPLVVVLTPRLGPVMGAMVVQAAAASLLTPAVSAISLAVAGRTRFSERLGRNSRYGSIGAAGGALMLGICIDFGLPSAVFLLSAVAMLPTLWALRTVGPDHVQLSRYGIQLPNQGRPPGQPGWHRLLGDRRLLIFALCVALFSLATAGVLQLATVRVNAHLGARSGLVIAAFVILPQIVVATISPAVARAANMYGRRAVLIAGFLTLPLRGALFALLRNAYVLIPVQILEGFGGSVYGVTISLVASDLAHRRGYYTLCLSLFGLAAGLGTTGSTVLAGLVADHFGRDAAFWALAGCGLLAVALVALAMPETSPPTLAHRRTRRRVEGIRYRLRSPSA